MQASNSFGKLCSVEAGPSLRELDLLPQVEEQFTTVQEVHHEVQLRIRLESVVKLDYEGTVNLFKDISLS